MFTGDQLGKAEEAITLYTSLVRNSEITSIERWGAGEEAGPEGSVKLARFTLNGIEFMASENAYPHEFTFTPSISMFAECASEAEIEAAFATLSEGGAVLMPLRDYGFSKRFGWLQDRYGVSWQLNLA